MSRRRARLPWPRSPAASWSRRVSTFALVLLLMSGLVHRLALLETLAFFWLLGLSALVACLGLGLGFLGLAQIWGRGMRGLRAALAGLLLGVIALLPFSISLYRLAVYPALVDVSTDSVRPPALVVAAARRAPPMNPLDPPGPDEAALQAEAYPQLAGRRYEHAMESVVDAVNSVLDRRGWPLRVSLPSAEVDGALTIEVLGLSYLLHLPADVAIRIEDRADATYVDMRSASRYGRHDMGDNAMRIQRFLDDLDARLVILGEV